MGSAGILNLALPLFIVAIGVEKLKILDGSYLNYIVAILPKSWLYISKPVLLAWSFQVRPSCFKNSL